MVTCEAMTPGEMKKAGEGVSIQYGVISTPFGKAILAWTERGICYLQFVDNQHQQVIDNLYNQWPKSSFILNTKFLLVFL